MFETSHPVLLFDYFRVPYRVVPADDVDLGWIRSAGENDRRVYWMPQVATGPAFYHLGPTPVFGRVADDGEAESVRARLPGSWLPRIPLTNADGVRVSAVWCRDDGAVLLPFDPGELITNLWSEAYARPTRGGGRRALDLYYRVRPVLPRQVQLALRRAYSRRQARQRFPRWPLEPGLHDLYDVLLKLCAQVAGGPIPVIASWPGGCRWAFVLTHDVETEVGYRNPHLLRDEEERAGLRSSWNFVPMRYAVATDVVSDLSSRGFEVGVHGLYHDGRDLASPELLAQRLPAMTAYAEHWGAVGFRSPATHRSWELMPRLGFDYDSSYPDSDPFEPQAGGCCSLLPYFNDNMVELPITLPQDHTLFVILGHRDEAPWLEKAAAVRDRGGMALLITHPDYMLDPHWTAVYARFLAAFRDDGSAWHALPRDVSAWWRRRAASSLEPDGLGWRVAGPAAGEGAVELVHPD